MRTTTTRGTGERRTRARGWMVAMLLAALLAAVAGCSGDDSDAPASLAAQDEVAAQETDADTGHGTDGAAAGAAADSDASGDDSSRELAIGAPLGRKVIHTARLTIEVDDPQAVVDRITSLTERVGGFVAGADLRRHGGEDERLRGTLTLRIPTGRLSSTLGEIRDLAERVPEQHLDTEDVSGEHADITAQLRNLRALEVELVALLEDIRARSESADEVLAVFERVRQVRGEIERLEGRREVLDDLVALATVVVDIEPTPLAVAEAPAEGWNPGATVTAAARTTLAALQELVEVAIWTVVTVLPIALLVLLPVAGGVYAFRHRRAASHSR